MATTASIKTTSGVVVSAEMVDGRVVLSQAGQQVGAGKWDGQRIVDCSARLGAVDGSETEAAYDALDAALEQAS
jgi:hypothetical protein